MYVCSAIRSRQGGKSLLLPPHHLRPQIESTKMKSIESDNGRKMNVDKNWGNRQRKNTDL